MSLTINESGKAVTETIDGVTMPAELSFAVVNDFVHGVDVHFEELQWLALGMATHIEQMQERLRAAEVERDELLDRQRADEAALSISQADYRKYKKNYELAKSRIEAAEKQEPSLWKVDGHYKSGSGCLFFYYGESGRQNVERHRDQGDKVTEFYALPPMPEQQDHGVLIEALVRCRQQASYYIGDSDALSGKLSKIREIVNETLNTRATK